MPRHLDEVLTQTKRFYTAKTHQRHQQLFANCSLFRYCSYSRAPVPQTVHREGRDRIRG